MAENPVEVVSELLGDMATRVGEYAAIWQHAAKRNAENNYDADDVVADIMRATGLAARDMANMGAAFAGMLGVVMRPADVVAQPATNIRKARAAKVTKVAKVTKAAKKLPARTAKKAPARKPSK